MLSILIPTYNYNVYPLVLELKEQADTLAITYEILVQDDNSYLFLEENEKINALSNCFFDVNNVNQGRGNNINLLNSKAKYEYVLIMEADAFPEKKEYLKILVSEIKPNLPIIFGGVSYPLEKPSHEKILRWKYGVNREIKTLKKRKSSPYSFVFSWNLLLQKNIISKIPFQTSIKHYGYEDVLFIKDLKKNKLKIHHIENQLIHYNSECNLTFIKKTETAIRTLNELVKNGNLQYKDTKITTFYRLLYLFGLRKIFLSIFEKSTALLIKKLDSKNPNLFYLDFYKLGYFCLINKNRDV
ncbi:B-glycosyltransferase-related protein, glycosyltransferase family 2 protein [Flavobacterium sp. 9AF]|uniref:glycosyltransferase n=1 Tax=Flavobacterium sp. 9AF TaxID=2653142 RepID=UPI0012F20B5F|nr:glycosyltransferase [Flavobacterium sp. 9AF]VXB68605.1 B-glycosyltransferase-related protein, glycosyltransferase family 2 protein [Flavobacterium sp. 9AF]